MSKKKAKPRKPEPVTFTMTYAKPMQIFEAHRYVAITKTRYDTLLDIEKAYIKLKGIHISMVQKKKRGKP